MSRGHNHFSYRRRGLMPLMPPWGLLLIWEERCFWAGVAYSLSSPYSIQWVGNRGMHRGLEEGDISSLSFINPGPIIHMFWIPPVHVAALQVILDKSFVRVSWSFLGAAALKLESILKSTIPQLVLDSCKCVGMQWGKLQNMQEKATDRLSFLDLTPGWLSHLLWLDQRVRNYWPKWEGYFH